MADLGILTTTTIETPLFEVLTWPDPPSGDVGHLEMGDQAVKMFQSDYLGDPIVASFEDNQGSIEILVLAENVNAIGALAILYDMRSQKILKKMIVGEDGKAVFTGLSRNYSFYRVVLSKDDSYRSMIFNNLTPT